MRSFGKDIISEVLAKTSLAKFWQSPHACHTSGTCESLRAPNHVFPSFSHCHVCSNSSFFSFSPFLQSRPPSSPFFRTLHTECNSCISDNGTPICSSQICSFYRDRRTPPFLPHHPPDNPGDSIPSSFCSSPKNHQ